MEEVVLPAKRADGLCNARVKGEYCLEPNIVPVVTALDKLSSMMEKENKRRSSGNLTLQRLAQVMTIVGGIIEAHVRDETVLREIRDDLLKVNLSLLMGGKK